jgi:hypothetical protein
MSVDLTEERVKELRDHAIMYGVIPDWFVAMCVAKGLNNDQFSAEADKLGLYNTPRGGSQ